MARTRTSATALALSILATLVPAEPAVALSSDEAAFVRWANQERARRGVRALVVRSDLVSVARKHAARMAQRRRIYHNSSLSSEVSGWRRIGENVGYDTSASAVQRRFMRSSGHRATILDARFNQIGVGVARAGGYLWVDEVFVLRGSTTTRAAPRVSRTRRTWSPPARVAEAPPPQRAVRKRAAPRAPARTVTMLLRIAPLLRMPPPPAPRPAPPIARL